MKTFGWIALCLAIAATTFAQSATYNVDPSHSSLVFSVSYNYSDFYGSFSEMEGSVKFEKEGDFTTSKVQFSVPIASINTNNKTRDGHLQGDRYFNAEKAASATFKSTYIKPLGDNVYEMTGELSVAGTTMAQTVRVEVLGKGMVGEKDKQQAVMGVKATFSFNRSNFGVTGGLPTIADKVDVVASLNMVKA